MRFRLATLALVLGLASAQAQQSAPEPEQEQGPELDFLEYLGAWAEEDDEWLAIEEWEKDNGTGLEEDAQGSDGQGDDEDESD
jgi:hypothetical protein